MKREERREKKEEKKRERRRRREKREWVPRPGETILAQTKRERQRTHNDKKRR